MSPLPLSRLNMTVHASVLPMSKNYGDVVMYTDEAIKHCAFLRRGQLLLIALMTGVDYDVGC